MGDVVVGLKGEFAQRVRDFAAARGVGLKKGVEALLHAGFAHEEGPGENADPGPPERLPAAFEDFDAQIAEMERLLEMAEEEALAEKERADRLEEKLAIADERIRHAENRAEAISAPVIAPVPDAGEPGCRCDGPAGPGNWHGKGCASYDPRIAAP